MCKCGFFSNPEGFSSIRESRLFVPQQSEIPKIVYSVTLSHNRTEITTYRIFSNHVVIKARIGDNNLLVFFKSRTSPRLQGRFTGHAESGEGRNGRDNEDYNVPSFCKSTQLC
jgi:hypothetical protein